MINLEQKDLDGQTALYWNAPACRELDCPVCFNLKKEALKFKKERRITADVVRVHNRFWRGWTLARESAVITFSDL